MPNVYCVCVCLCMSYETRFSSSSYICFVGQTTQFLSWTTFFQFDCWFAQFFFYFDFPIYSRKSSSLLSSYRHCSIYIYKCIVSIKFISFYRRTESCFILWMLLWKKDRIHESKKAKIWSDDDEKNCNEHEMRHALTSWIFIHKPVHHIYLFYIYLYSFCCRWSAAADVNRHIPLLCRWQNSRGILNVTISSLFYAQFFFLGEKPKRRKTHWNVVFFWRSNSLFING